MREQWQEFLAEEFQETIHCLFFFSGGGSALNVTGRVKGDETVFADFLLVSKMNKLLSLPNFIYFTIYFLSF